MKERESETNRERWGRGTENERLSGHKRGREVNSSSWLLIASQFQPFYHSKLIIDKTKQNKIPPAPTWCKSRPRTSVSPGTLPSLPGDLSGQMWGWPFSATLRASRSNPSSGDLPIQVPELFLKLDFKKYIYFKEIRGGTVIFWPKGYFKVLILSVKLPEWLSITLFREWTIFSMLCIAT